MKLTIEGTHQTVSKPAIRAWFQASATVLAYHNFHCDEINLRILPLNHPDFNSPARFENNTVRVGLCKMRLSPIEIIINDHYDLDSLGTVILHEMIHAACQTFGSERRDVSLEKCTSTLTARLKPTVSSIAQILLDNTFRNAAYVAHTRKGMAYRTDPNDDFYDQAQWVRTKPEDPYSKG